MSSSQYITSNETRRKHWCTLFIEVIRKFGASKILYGTLGISLFTKLKYVTRQMLAASLGEPEAQCTVDHHIRHSTQNLGVL